MDFEDREHFQTIAGALRKPQTGLSNEPKKENSPSDLDPAYCLKASRVLFACYRRDEAADPELYCAAVAATFAGFSKQVVDHVSDPRTGIASELKFLPAVAEVRASCVATASRMVLLAKPSVELRRSPQPLIKREPGTGYFEMFEKHGRPTGFFEQPGDKWNKGKSEGNAP